MKTRVTVESMSVQFDEDRAFAKACNQAGPAHAASVSKARLHGLIVERKESGKPGEFGTMTSPDEIVAAIRAELGDKAADLLLASVGRGEAIDQDHDGPAAGEAIN